MKMKLLMVLGLLAAAAAAVGYDQWQQSRPAVVYEDIPAATVAMPAPPVRFATTDGRTVNGWGQIDSPYIVVNVWASWCPPCLAEMPRLLELTAKGDVTLVALNVDKDYADMARLVESWQNLHPAWAASDKVMWVWDKNRRISLGSLGMAKVPETIVIDASRRITRKVVGEVPEVLTNDSRLLLPPPAL